MDEDAGGRSPMANALHHAIFIGDETAVRMILDAGVSPKVQSSQFYTTLATAAEAGQRSIDRLLWQLVGPDGRSAPRAPNCLDVAAGNGHADLVSDFLDMWDGWPMDEKRWALDTAASRWRDNVVGVLLAKSPTTQTISSRRSNWVSPAIRFCHSRSFHAYSSPQLRTISGSRAW